MKNTEHNRNLASFDMLDLAPKVTGMLSNGLSTSDLKEICRAFAKVSSAITLSDAPIIRPIGASFNSKPARILEILWRDGGQHNAFILRAALLSLSLEKEIVPQGFSEQELNLSQESLKYDGTTLVCREAEAIALARAIDLAWHLHMTNLDSNEKDKTATKLECILARSKTNNLYPRMCQILETSLTRFRRRKVS